MQISDITIDPAREAAYQKWRAQSLAAQTPEQAKALGQRLAQYRVNKVRRWAEGR